MEKKWKVKKSTTEEEETEGEIEKKKSKGAQEEKIPGAPTYVVVPASMAGMGITIEEDEQLPDIIF